MNQLGFNVDATLKFQNKELKLDREINSVKINMGDGILVPSLEMTFYVESSLVSQLFKPYTVELTIVERNGKADDKTYITGTFLSFSNKASIVKREPNQPSRVDRELITHTYLLQNAYSMANTHTGGLFHSKTIKQVIQSIWPKVSNGLQLNLGNFDEKETYENIFLPNDSFSTLLRYISQYYGFYSNIPLMYTDLKSFNIKSVNEVKDQPITLYLREESKEHKIKIDELKYAVYSLPSFQNAINRITTKIPKKITMIKNEIDTLFSIEELDTIKHLRSENTVQTTALYDTYFDKYIQPNMTFMSNKSSTLPILENLSSILVNTVKPTKISIPDPFRFNHWFIGRKVKVESTHVMHSDLDVTYYVSGLSFNISQNQEKQWRGTVDVTLKTASTRNVEV